jgi:UDP-N-acetylmuramate dehydrogenase
MKIDLHASLRAHNTFGFDVSAEYLVHLTQADEIPVFIQKALDQGLPWQVFGGGSNLVLAADLRGYTGLMQIMGRHLKREDANYFYVEAMAGESWHDFVLWSLEQGYPGLENLALIPGTVGASPIQNIGAYGLEVAQVFDSLEAFDVQEKCFVHLSYDDCAFAYRHSLFKEDPKRYIVISVCFKLPKKWQANLSYVELEKAFANAHAPSAKDIFNKVCEIRSAKLPDPKVLGNSGSFFHNPVVTDQKYQELKKRFPNLIAYSYADGWKLAAGWLIDQCGLKGHRLGQLGVYEKQALVLINHGGGTGPELLALAQDIQDKVLARFDVHLSIEPVIFK